MQDSSYGLVSFLKERSNAEVERVKKDEPAVVCSYSLTSTKFYIIFIVWLKYFYDVLISYNRQFSYLNSVETVPDELRPFYTQTEFDEAKIEYMFRTLMTLDFKFNQAIHLTVIYLTNIYCTLWWLASRISNNILTTTLVYNLMSTVLQYRDGDLIYHISILLSSYSVGERVTRISLWLKDTMVKGMKHVATFSFIEQLVLSIILTLMTTPMVIVLFLVYRVYTTLVFPTILEERLSQLAKLEDGALFSLILKICEKFNFPIHSIYVSQKFTDAHTARVKGAGDIRYLVLGCKLVEGHEPKGPTPLYTDEEIVAAVLRAQARFTLAKPTQDMILEAIRWVTVLWFAILLWLGLCGGSRVGFVPSPPQVVAFTISQHLSIPLLLVTHIIENSILRQKHFELDNKVAQVGFGEHLISYFGKESRYTHRCPIEDPFYTLAYSERPTLIQRVRNLRSLPQKPNH